MKKILSIFLLMVFTFSFSQTVEQDTLRSSDLEKNIIKEIEEANAPSAKNALNPTKAGLYSAVLPGLGQYYNKKYWKIPIVWGAVGTGVGIVLWNDKQYKRYRNAFVAELNGLPHEFSNIPNATKEALGRTQDARKRDRDYAIAVTSLIYVLGVMDAVVDAHLSEQRKDPDLAIKPAIIYDQYGTQSAKAGLSLNFKF